MAQLINGNEVVTPTKADAAVARKSSEVLLGLLGEDTKRAVSFKLKAGSETGELVLPPSALRLLVRILTEIGQGNAVTLTPLHAELTTGQAADLLNVSRPHLVKLLDEGAMPSRMVGTHRRVKLEDLLAYKKEFLAKRHTALDELTAVSQDLKMGY